MNKNKRVEVLKYLFGEIYRSDRHKQQLEMRLRSMAGKCQDGKEQNGDRQASACCWKSGIAARIWKQKREIEQAVNQVMDILDALPINSIERQVCELRHIDFKTWGEISAEIPMSRSQVNRRYKNALGLLLKNQHIQNIVEEHEEAYDKYIDNMHRKRGVRYR